MLKDNTTVTSTSLFHLPIPLMDNTSLDTFINDSPFNSFYAPTSNFCFDKDIVENSNLGKVDNTKVENILCLTPFCEKIENFDEITLFDTLLENFPQNSELSKLINENDDKNKNNLIAQTTDSDRVYEYDIYNVNNDINSLIHDHNYANMNVDSINTSNITDITSFLTNNTKENILKISSKESKLFFEPSIPSVLSSNTSLTATNLVTFTREIIDKDNLLETLSDNVDDDDEFDKITSSSKDNGSSHNKKKDIIEDKEETNAKNKKKKSYLEKRKKNNIASKRHIVLNIFFQN